MQPNTAPQYLKGTSVMPHSTSITDRPVFTTNSHTETSHQSSNNIPVPPLAAERSTYHPRFRPIRSYTLFIDILLPEIRAITFFKRHPPTHIYTPTESVILTEDYHYRGQGRQADPVVKRGQLGVYHPPPHHHPPILFNLLIFLIKSGQTVSTGQ